MLSNNNTPPLEFLAQYPPHDYTLNGAIESRARSNPERPFLIFEGKTWSWGQFSGAVIRLASALAARGVHRGERIAISATNHPAHLLLMFALARLRAIFVLVNLEFGVYEAGYVLSHAQVSGIVCDSDTLAVARQAVADAQPAPWLALIEGDAHEAMSLETLTRNVHGISLPNHAEASDTFIILYTSGTTGFPKGVMHSQQSFVLAGERHVERVHLQPDDRALCVLPMFHNNALFNITAGTVAAGASLVLVRKFSASQFWRVVADHGVTQVNVMAAVSTILARRPRSEYVPGHTLHVVNGSGFTAETLDVFTREFQLNKVIEGLGMTEIPGAFSIPFEAPHKLACMGKPGRHPDHALPWTEARIVDDCGADMPEGETGELLVRIPTVMQGYWRDPVQTAASFRDGWFVTGDLVRRDGESYYYHIGRKKDLIRRRGENISATEIERVLCAHPAVAEAAALPVEAEVGEEEVMAVIVAWPGVALTAAEIRDWCAQHFAAFKAPRYVAFVGQLPHTPTHKVAKHVLKQDTPSLRAKAVDTLNNPAT
jgi:carnitine-CoA ligase